MTTLFEQWKPPVSFELGDPDNLDPDSTGWINVNLVLFLFVFEGGFHFHAWMKHSRYDDDEDKEDEEEFESEDTRERRQEKSKRAKDELSRLDVNEWFVFVLRDVLENGAEDTFSNRKAMKEFIRMGDAGIDLALLIAECYNFKLTPCVTSSPSSLPWSSSSKCARPYVSSPREYVSFDVFPLSLSSLSKLWLSDEAGPSFFEVFLSDKPEKVVRDFGEHEEQLRHLESISFMLSEPDIVRILHYQGFRSRRPCILSWLKSAGVYNKALNVKKQLHECQNALGIKLLIKEGRDPNAVFDTKQKYFDDDYEQFVVKKGCALAVVTNLSVLDALLEYGAKLEVLRSCGVFPPSATFRHLLLRRPVDMKRIFPAKLVFERVAADVVWKDMRWSWLECVQILREFDYDIVEEDWKHLANPDLESALFTFQYLKKREKSGTIWWRPHTHFLFSKEFQNKVVFVTFVLMQIRPRLPRELRKKILVIMFGREENGWSSWTLKDCV